MRHIFTEAIRLSERGEPFALATVVETRGSTPQKMGARLLVRADGTMVGTLGGGCVEAEVWQEAVAALRSGDGPVLRDFSLSDDLAAESGMVCGGTMVIFIEPVTDGLVALPWARAVAEALAGGEVAILATLVATPPPDRLGAKLLLKGGAAVGSLGKAVWDEATSEAAGSLQARGSADLVRLAEGARAFVESFRTPPTILLAGAGHIAEALCPLARQLGFRVAVIDDRADFANWERFPEADEVIVADIATGVREFPVTPSTAIVVATRGHKQDSGALAEAVRSPAGYVGMVSSRRKVALIYLQLLGEGIPAERLREVHAPVGLDIGARTPEEIALSILAEVVMIRSGKRGGSLKLDEGRLHRVEGKRARSARAD